ncbi:MAG: hypothetical protein EOO60_02845 [Hymenobacter sp.]|nr:MAG: hypothetical protein EOO60_02845 [Hymenobacter sp.]
MSVALLIERSLPGEAEPARRAVPVAGEQSYWEIWNPLIEKEGFEWLPLMGSGLPIDAENLPEVLHELRRLLAAVPRYYEPNSISQQRMTERLDPLIAELTAVDKAELSSGSLELWIG